MITIKMMDRILMMMTRLEMVIMRKRTRRRRKYYYYYYYYYYWLMMRQTELHTAEPLVTEPSAFEFELAIEKLKSHK
jgi:hypothetical protein